MGSAKHISLFLLLSVCIILGAHYLFMSSQWLITGYKDATDQLQVVFASNSLGQFFSGFIALLGIPLLCVSAIALIYWAFKRTLLPNYWLYLWTIWLVLATLVISQG